MKAILFDTNVSNSSTIFNLNITSNTATHIVPHILEGDESTLHTPPEILILAY
jgi:hypothetical protein